MLAYFGYPRAHEDDAERAVRAGLAVIDAVRKMPTPELLQARIGLATGLAVVCCGSWKLLRNEIEEWRQDRAHPVFFAQDPARPEFLPQHRGGLLAVIEAATSLQDALDAIVRVEH